MGKRIIFFCGGSYVFGKEIVALSLLKQLRDKGVQIHCIVNGWNNGDMPDRLQKLGITFNELKIGFLYVRKPFWTLDSLLHYPGALFKLNKIINSFVPDYLYFNSERTLLSVAPLVKDRKVILHINEPIVNSRLNRFIIDLFNDKNITYVVCSNFIKKKLSILLQPLINKKPVHIIFSAVEIRERAAKVDRNKAVLNIGVVGQLRYHKGQDILFRALSKLRQFRFKCLIFGDGDQAYKKELLKLASDLDIEDRVVFKGFVKDIDCIYESLDLVVVPSRSEEPFGLVAVEPAQWKIPVIVSNRGGLPEVIKDGETGLVFEGEDGEDLARKIKVLIADQSLRHKLGTNALERAKCLFDVKTMGEKFYELIT